MSRNSVADVVVLGGGPAGLASAIALAQAGCHVSVFTRGQNRPDRIGESLSPSATPILKQLGVWASFTADGHLPCYGNASSWDSPELRYYDFIHDPNGHAWHIDRALFERCLTLRTHELGVRLAEAKLRDAVYTGGIWHLRFANGGPTVKTRFVIDATGRSSWFARRQGAQRCCDDFQIALFTFLHTKREPLIDTTSLVEAVDSGWWYTARVPDGRLAIAHFSDADLIERRAVRESAGWDALVGETRYTARRVRDAGYSLERTPRFVPAGSSCLDRIVGEGWVAVGDAAMCYDPLSAHGLTLALASGRDAAMAVSAHLRGNRDPLRAYEGRLKQAYADYRRIRAGLYGDQMRWPGAAYWNRRRKAPVPPQAEPQGFVSSPSADQTSCASP